MNGVLLRFSVAFVAVVLIAASVSLYLSTHYLDQQQRLSVAGDTEGAMHDAELASKLAPFSAEALQAKAGMLRSEGRNREAERVLQAATEREPSNYEVWQELGDLRLDAMNRPLEAVESYRRAVDLNPKSSDMRTGLAKAYLSVGKLDKAKTQYEKIKAEKLDVEQLYDLGRIYVRTGEPDKGVRTLQQVRNRTEDGLRGLTGQQLQQQLGFITSVELAITDGLVVQRRYGEAYQVVANSSSEQAPTIMSLISSDPEGYRQTVINSDVY